MEYLAHSAKDDYPAQPYANHVDGVLCRAVRYAEETEAFSSRSSGILLSAVRNSARLHDLGKLNTQNQEVLHGKIKSAHLPINHVDAGAAALFLLGDEYAAQNVFSHHRGLPDMDTEDARETPFRDEKQSVRRTVDAELDKLLSIHGTICSPDPDQTFEPIGYEGDLGVFYRMMLSCLADADHADTAAAYGQAPLHKDHPALRAEERLAALDRYVSELGKDDERSFKDDERSLLRREMYFSCRDARSSDHFIVCDSPVGSGKTTAIMAHLLQQAKSRRSRRIFVVLPYTSIITQSVDVYRKALVLPGEDPEEVVAELHCRADFSDKDIRYLTSLWKAPIIVTTAVAFFETLASNRPAALRRLHELPGSVIFIDESHNALPVKLLPLAWKWMNILADEWSCYWTLASGSLVRFWQLKSLQRVEIPRPTIPELVAPSLRSRLMQYEKDRITFRWADRPLNRTDLIELAVSLPGPRLLIVNTVQTAAVLANDLCDRFGRDRVEHLSTALSAADRKATIERVKARLNDPDDDDWTLVATSCVEAGVDFSFRSGLREFSSLLSLLQAAGRVNRHEGYPGAEMWSFSLQEDSLVKKNPSLSVSIEVIREMFARSEPISPEASTKALDREIIRNDSCISTIIELLKNEESQQFSYIADKFVVIDSDTVTVVVDDELCQKIRFGQGDWKELQKSSVSIQSYKARSWSVEEIAEGIYRWTLRYDPFIGYMRGVLDLEAAKNDTLMH